MVSVLKDAYSRVTALLVRPARTRMKSLKRLAGWSTLTSTSTTTPVFAADRLTWKSNGRDWHAHKHSRTQGPFGERTACHYDQLFQNTRKLCDEEKEMYEILDTK